MDRRWRRTLECDRRTRAEASDTHTTTFALAAVFRFERTTGRESGKGVRLCRAEPHGRPRRLLSQMLVTWLAAAAVEYRRWVVFRFVERACIEVPLAVVSANQCSPRWRSSAHKWEEQQLQVCSGKSAVSQPWLRYLAPPLHRENVGSIPDEGTRSQDASGGQVGSACMRASTRAARAGRRSKASCRGVQAARGGAHAPVRIAAYNLGSRALKPFGVKCDAGAPATKSEHMQALPIRDSGLCKLQLHHVGKGQTTLWVDKHMLPTRVLCDVP